MKTRALIVLGGGRNQLSTIAHAQKLNFEVVVIDNIADSPGHMLADHSFIQDSTDREAAIKIAKQFNVIGAIAPCTDVAVSTAAAINESLGINNISIEISEILTSKISFRQFQKENCLSHPDFAVMKPGTPMLRDFSRSWVVKPDISSGSKGVSIVDEERQLDIMLEKASSVSLNSKVIVEEMLPGHHGTAEGVLINGQIEQLYLLDRRTLKPPLVCTMGHCVPSILPNAVTSKIRDELTRFWNLTDINDTVFDVDFIWHNNRFTILEASPRLGGNSISKLLEYAYGVNLIGDALSANGLVQSNAISSPRASSLVSAVILLGADRDGTLTVVTEQIEALRAKKWVKAIEVFARNGDDVSQFTDGRGCLAAVFIESECHESLDGYEKLVRSTNVFDVR